MTIDIITCQAPVTMEPLTCKRGYEEICVAGTTLPQALKSRVAGLAEKMSKPNHIAIRVDAWLSDALLERVLAGNTRVVSKSGEPVAWALNSPEYTDVNVDDESIIIQYPWDVITVNEQIVSQLDQDEINGKIYDGAQVEGHLILGEGSVLLPGVFIEGNVIIGKNCKVGPNCYIRGNSVIMDNCHVGQSVEIKNSILMNNVAAGHLTYLGDSIICPYTNFGAGTITANFRHDGKNHRSMADGVLLDTGRRKLGAIIGDHVHTGIHTSIYPGRKIWPDMMTLPGDIVQKDLKN